MPLKQILTMESNRKEDEQSSKTITQPAPALHRKGPNFAKKKDKFGRKRSQSFSGVNSKFCPPYKYRTRPMLPTKFLLGGNICDPLNLNSLQDEEVNRTVNAITPKSSPIPTPPQRRGHIEVIIPPNIHDPLNLIDCADDAEYEQQLTSPLKKGNKRRKKKKRTSSATTEPSDADISASEAQTPDLSNDSAKIPDLEPTWSGAEEPAAKEKLSRVTRELKLELTPVKDKKRKSDSHKEGVKKLRRLDSMDKIVSPVVPQPGAWLKRALQFNRNTGPSNRGQNSRPSGVKTKEPGAKVPHFRDKNKAYQYGNYNRYYGYRNPNHEVDSRLRCFAAHQHIFEGRDILDIGCNIGHITLSIARDFGAKSVVGIDIDKKLIGIARKNVRHYVNCNDSPRDDPPGCSPRLDKNDKCFPISMPILYGPVDVPGMQNDEVRGRGFPHNVTFVQGNYVLEDDSLLSTEQPQFDVILCLSITKWLHLNWGDAGLKQAFRRMYAQLKPGGKLILEPQSWASYKHKKTLTETIYKNYHSIEFFPEKFTQYLLSSEVGFAKSEIMGQPHHAAKGFQRPIQVFTRSNLSPSQSQRSYSITPSHTLTSGGCAARGVAGKQVYTCLPSPEVREDEATSARVELDACGTSGEQLEPVRGGRDTSSSCAASGKQVEVSTEESACARVELEGCGTTGGQLEPMRSAREELEGRMSTGGERRHSTNSDRGTRKENQRAEPVGSKVVGDVKSSYGVGSEERVNKTTDRADKREAGVRREDHRDTGRKSADEGEKGSRVMGKAEKDSMSVDTEEIVCKIADNRAKSADNQARITEQARMTDNRAKIADNEATVTRQAKLADNQAKLADKQAKLADNQAKMTDKQATVTDNQAKGTNKSTNSPDNQTTSLNNQAKLISNPVIQTSSTYSPVNQITPLNSSVNQAKLTSNPNNQATLTSSSVNQAKLTSNPNNQAKLTSSPVNQAKLTCSPVNQAKLTCSPVNQAKLPNNPHNQPAAPTNVTETSPTPANTPDNQESSPKSPQNRVPSPITNNTCKNTDESRDKNTSNNVVGSHLGTRKRIHTPHAAPANPDSDSSPAKRQFVSPVKRKTLAVKRTYTDDAKRKNDQSTTDDGSTLTELDSTLISDGGTRLADTQASDEEFTTDCQSTTPTTGTTGGQSTTYRRMQKTKCIMDNT